MNKAITKQRFTFG